MNLLPSDTFSRRCLGIIAAGTILLTAAFFSRHTPQSVSSALCIGGGFIIVAVTLVLIFYRINSGPLK